MSEIKNGGPAFPHEYKYVDGTAHRDDGMSLRDYFAAAWVANKFSAYDGPDRTATNAYAIADAMLRAREAK